MFSPLASSVFYIKDNPFYKLSEQSSWSFRLPTGLGLYHQFQYDANLFTQTDEILFRNAILLIPAGLWA
jgi:hypothetical protein